MYLPEVKISTSGSAGFGKVHSASSVGLGKGSGALPESWEWPFGLCLLHGLNLKLLITFLNAGSEASERF